MIEREKLDLIKRIEMPPRYAVDLLNNGLSIQQIASPKKIIEAEVSPYRSRSTNCRRVLAEIDSGEKFVLEFSSFKDDYPTDISGIIRSSCPVINDDLLLLDNSKFRDKPPTNKEVKKKRNQVANSWHTGIRFQREIQKDGKIIRKGLRTAQSGALHAIAAHWTLTDTPALVVMPTGTGKTEVMIAAAIDSSCNRLLVIVPSNALRQQTADKFSTYGILQKIGVIDDLPFPVVGKLSSKPTMKHLKDLELCNVVIVTMSALGRADENIQKAVAQRFSHIFFDEAHHIEATTWKRFQKQCNKLSTLLLTATPFREDGKPIDGRIVYNFPLSKAQSEECFRPIHFIDVFEPDDSRADHAIAHAAVERLREDLAKGFDHFLMARAQSISAARELYENVYQPQYSDLNPVLIHSGTSGYSLLNGKGYNFADAYFRSDLDDHSPLTPDDNGLSNEETITNRNEDLIVRSPAVDNWKEALLLSYEMRGIRNKLRSTTQHEIYDRHLELVGIVESFLRQFVFGNKTGRWSIDHVFCDWIAQLLNQYVPSSRNRNRNNRRRRTKKQNTINELADEWKESINKKLRDNDNFSKPNFNNNLSLRSFDYLSDRITNFLCQDDSINQDVRSIELSPPLQQLVQLPDNSVGTTQWNNIILMLSKNSEDGLSNLMLAGKLIFHIRNILIHGDPYYDQPKSDSEIAVINYQSEIGLILDVRSLESCFRIVLAILTAIVRYQNLTKNEEFDHFFTVGTIITDQENN